MLSHNNVSRTKPLAEEAPFIEESPGSSHCFLTSIFILFNGFSFSDAFACLLIMSLINRHRWTGRFEAHLWDKSTWNSIQNKKGRQGNFLFCGEKLWLNWAKLSEKTKEIYYVLFIIFIMYIFLMVMIIYSDLVLFHTISVVATFTYTSVAALVYLGKSLLMHLDLTQSLSTFQFSKLLIN